MKALLILSDGTTFEGSSIGVSGTSTGEVVFNTSMTGYQEILTDPSYAGQLVALTYPLIGNYGINTEDGESVRPQVSGLIVKEMCGSPSNYRSSAGGDEYLKRSNIVGIQGVDVRALVKNLRDHGVMLGMITTEHSREDGLQTLHDLPDYDAGTYAREVSTRRPYQWQTGENMGATPAQNANAPQDQWQMPLDATARVVVLDYGTKFNILRNLRERGLEVVVLPCNSTREEIMAWQPDGILLSNGPGDPKALEAEVQTIQELQAEQPELPMFGICLGHQLLGRALGGDTFKLKFGHRGANHPVKDLTTGKVHITSQNHGYAVTAESLPQNVEVTHLNLNDNTVEGLRHKDKPLFSVQYHPEASPGPKDNAHLFDKFAEMVKEKKEKAMSHDLPPIEEAYIVPTELIEPNPDQPRKHFDADDLQSLADSIRSLGKDGQGINHTGIILPLTVRRSSRRPDGKQLYTIIAGERRWRAAKMAGCDYLPVVVQDVGDAEAALTALIENIHREDLNPIEMGKGFGELRSRLQSKLEAHLQKARQLSSKDRLTANEFEDILKEFDATPVWILKAIERAKKRGQKNRQPRVAWEDVADASGFNVDTMRRYLRFAKVDPLVQEMVAAGKIGWENLNTIASLEDKALQRKLAQDIVRENLSAKEADKRARELEKPSGQEYLANSIRNSTNEHEFGPPLNLEGLRHAPINELGVVFLFGILAENLGFVVEGVRAPYPDCVAKRYVDDKREKMKPVRIEFEFRSRNCVPHKHDLQKVDLIVCWEHNWPDCPIEVLELKSAIKNLKPAF